MSTQLAEQDAELAAYIGYLANQRKLAKLTLENYQRDLQQLNLWRGEQSWSAIRTADIRKFAAKMHAQGLNPRSIARKLSSWRGFFAWLALQNSLLINPVDGVKAPKRSKPLPKALSVDQAAFLLEGKVATPQAGLGRKPGELLEDADQTMHVCNMAMFELLYSSGLRVSEIVSLDWRYHNQASDWPDYVSAGWVDLDEQMLQVVGKGSKTRLVPVGKLAIAALRRWLQLRPQLARQDASRDAHALFLNQQGRRISSRVLQMRLSKHAQLVGMPSHVHPHVLRHSFASHVLQSSGDLRAVQEMLGHASISSTQVYTALDFQHLAQVYDAAHPRAKEK